MVCLDYRACGPSGEPRVVHVDQEWDYQITIVAESFEAFIRGLEPDNAFEDEASVRLRAACGPGHSAGRNRDDHARIQAAGHKD
jgi:hypothetical protein